MVSTIPPRGGEKRKQGSGKWLEEKLVEAFEDRWELKDRARKRTQEISDVPVQVVDHQITPKAWRNGDIWGQEIDVFADIPQSPGRLICQCKDWREGPITPATIWRLIAIAYTIRAKPVLVTDARLTSTAETICDHWEVTRWSMKDVIGYEWPGYYRRPYYSSNPKWCDKYGDEEMRQSMLKSQSWYPFNPEKRPKYLF